MRFKLYVELASRVENERILDLFRFPTDAVLPSEVTWSAKWWANGHTTRMRSKDREKILLRLTDEGFNEIDLRYTTKAERPGKDLRPVGGGTLLPVELSPKNILWAPVSEEAPSPPTTPQRMRDDRQRQNFAMHARAVSATWIDGQLVEKPWPTEVGHWVDVETSTEIADHMELQRLCVDLIRSASPPGLRECDVFGYGCIGGECRSAGMLTGASRGTLDDLGDKFENIYPILIGPKTPCEGLAEALGGIEKWPLFEEHDSPTCILSIPPELAVVAGPRPPHRLAHSATDPAVRRWLVDWNSPEAEKRFEEDSRRGREELKEMQPRINAAFKQARKSFRRKPS